MPQGVGPFAPGQRLGYVTGITVHRAAVFSDGFKQMSGLSAPALKGRLQLQFINEHGETEAGVDGGGLFKDFMEHLLQVRATHWLVV